MREHLLTLALLGAFVLAGVAGLAGVARARAGLEDPERVCARALRLRELEVRREEGRFAPRVDTVCGTYEVELYGDAYFVGQVGRFRVYPDGIVQTRP